MWETENNSRNNLIIPDKTDPMSKNYITAKYKVLTCVTHQENHIYMGISLFLWFVCMHTSVIES